MRRNRFILVAISAILTFVALQSFVGRERIFGNRYAHGWHGRHWRHVHRGHWFRDDRDDEKSEPSTKDSTVN